METGRNNGDGISGRQLRELLRSLPAAHAPEDLELNLMYRIAENKTYPHRSRPRFPRARARSAASEGAARTRGYDRVRGLAAAALAAFIVAGGWTFYSERSVELPADQPAQVRTVEAASQVSPSQDEATSKTAERPGTLLNPTQTIVIEKVGDGDLEGGSLQNENGLAVPAESNVATSAPTPSEQKQRATSRRETTQASQGTAVVPTTHAPSSMTSPPADTLSSRTTPAAPAGGLDVGTGGEPPEREEE